MNTTSDERDGKLILLLDVLPVFLIGMRFYSLHDEDALPAGPTRDPVLARHVDAEVAAERFMERNEI